MSTKLELYPRGTTCYASTYLSMAAVGLAEMGDHPRPHHSSFVH